MLLPVYLRFMRSLDIALKVAYLIFYTTANLVLNCLAAIMVTVLKALQPLAATLYLMTYFELVF